MKTLPPKKLKIEMVHDIICSWCPIGYSNIKAAINNLNIEVDFHFLPYQLNPNMDENGESIANYFSRQFGWDEQTLLKYQESLVTTATNAGINIDFTKRTHYYPTHNAHLLMQWAERFNKQIEVNECLIEAYFTHGKNINDIAVLLQIAGESGLNKQAANDALSSTKLRKILNQSLKQNAISDNRFNIKNIPAFIFNEKVMISGSNSVKYFEEALSAFIKK